MIKIRVIIILLSILIIQTHCDTITSFHLSQKGSSPPVSFSPHFFPWKGLDILNNENFHQQAATKGWDLNETRDGTSSRPYLIQGHRFSGDRFEEKIVFISNTNLYFQMKNCRISGGFYSIRLKNVTNGVISMNQIHNSEIYGISIESSDNITVDRNVIYDYTEGIVLQNSANCHISNNDVSGGEKGISLFDSNSSTITGNVAYNNNWEGIALKRCKQTSILNNSCHNNGYGISFGSTGICANNSIFNNSDTGLRVTSNNVVMTGNSITKNNGIGIYVGSATGIQVSKNYISQNLYGGIEFRKTKDGTIFNNSVIDNGEDGVILNGANGSTITSNTVSLNTQSGIRSSHGLRSTITENTIQLNEENGIYFYNSNQSVLDNNRIIENRENGIRFFYSSRNILVNNNISRNYRHGISIDEFSFCNNISYNTITVNKEYGIFLGSENNTIYGNQFSNNKESIGYSTNWNDFGLMLLVLGILVLNKQKRKTRDVK